MEPGELCKLGLIIQRMLRSLQHDPLQPKACFTSCLLRELPALQMDSDLVMTGNSKGRLLLRGTDLVDSSVLLLAEARKSVP